MGNEMVGLYGMLSVLSTSTRYPQQHLTYYSAVSTGPSSVIKNAQANTLPTKRPQSKHPDVHLLAEEIKIRDNSA